MIYAAAEKVLSVFSHAAGSMTDPEPLRRHWDSVISESVKFGSNWRKCEEQDKYK